MKCMKKVLFKFIIVVLSTFLFVGCSMKVSYEGKFAPSYISANGFASNGISQNCGN